MITRGEFPVNKNDNLDEFAHALSEQVNVEGVLALGNRIGANTHLFDNTVNPPYRYPYESVDMIATIDGRPTRLFVHKNFPPALQEAGEAILDQAGLSYFPATAQGELFTVRHMPVVTMPLLSHELNQVTALNVSRNYLAPVIRQLFEGAGVVPSRETLANLTRIEDLHQDENANQHLELGTRFIPPYAFEEVSEAEFVQKALLNAADYGHRVVTDLGYSLATPA